MDRERFIRTIQQHCPEYNNDYIYTTIHRNTLSLLVGLKYNVYYRYTKVFTWNLPCAGALTPPPQWSIADWVIQGLGMSSRVCVTG